MKTRQEKREKMKKRWISIMMIVCLLFVTIPVQGKSERPSISYQNKNYRYEKKRLQVKCDGKKLSMKQTPGLILEEGVVFLPAYEVFKQGLSISYTYDEAKKTITFQYNDSIVKLYVDKTKAVVNGKKKTLLSVPRFVKFNDSKKTRLMVPAQFVAKNLGLKYEYQEKTGTVSIKHYTKGKQKEAFPIRYQGESQTYNGVQYTIYVDGKKIDTKESLTGMTLNGITYIPAKATVRKGKLGIRYNYKNSKLTLTNTKKTVVVKKDSNVVIMNGKEKKIKSPLVIVKNKETQTSYVMISTEVLERAFGFQCIQNEEERIIVFSSKIQPEEQVEEIEEVKAMWVSYIELGWEKKTESQWKAKIDKIMDRCVSYQMNTVIFHVRPFGDAVYKSNIFPWSKYVSGTQGTNPGYDPFAYVVKAAHKRGLKIEAWINPYRISSSTTDVTKLSKNNPARKFRSTKGKERYVLSHGGGLYYNPAKKEVQQLIVDGVKEIVENYDVDGIHLDDYFYPELGSSYRTNFDATEYKKSGSKLSIANWRRQNVNNLVKSLYQAVKEEGENIKFGISPAGNIGNLKDDTMYYVDIETWLTKKGYVDYICPQIYWNFQHKIAAYDKVTDQWVQLNKANIVDLYIGIPVYRAGDPSIDGGQWARKTTILRDQIRYARKTKAVKGFMFFSYDSFQRTVAQKEVKNLIKELKK